MTDPPRITVLCGGVGAARFLTGLVQVVPAARTTAVVNVADDTILHGLHVSPDIDTVTYTLAGEIDPDRGWGLRDESWQAMTTLTRFGDGDWFSLGDRDLGTHLHRTGRLAQGASLTEVTAEITSAWGVDVHILPVTDDRVATMVTLAETGETVSFQEYFVRRRHDVAVSAIAIVGADRAAPTPAVEEALDADLVIIAPSNPIVSIEPVLAVGDVRARLTSRREPTIAISPIVGGEALKGPAARMLVELGHEPSALGVARLLTGVADYLVIDQIDAGLACAVAATGIIPVVTDTIMADPTRSAALARLTVSAALGV